MILSAGKKKRMQVFSELYEFNEKLIVNLKFDRRPVGKVAEGFKFMPKILNGERVLDERDDDLLFGYVRDLGKSDALSQIDYLSAKSAALLKLKDETFTEYKKYSSLYIKIFFMIGVLAAVLLA